MAKSDAETGGVPAVGTASAGGVGVGVDRVTLYIHSQDSVTRTALKVSRGSNRSDHSCNSQAEAF